jgi:hypothetical protein
MKFQKMEQKLPDIIKTLPEPIRAVVEKMETIEEKKMAIYASSVIAGSLMPHVHINYDNKINYPALMLLISYPPASGKGKLAMLVSLVSKIVGEQIADNMSAIKQYRSQLKLAERLIKKGEKVEFPDKPRTPLLLIPANTTSSKLIEQMSENRDEMMALLFETETDAITNIMGTKFGLDNSMIFRKVYHHESISQMRKTNDEHFEITNPKMAIVLTGTHSQIPRLFQSNQDGLLSRFIIVMGDAPLIWKDVNPCEECRPLDEFFNQLASEFYLIYQFFKTRKVEVKLTDYQWTSLNNMGKIWITESNYEGGEYAVSLAKRHANMVARLAMIFTMLRYYKSNDSLSTVYCSDQDYLNAEFLLEQSFQSSMELFKQLPGEQIVGHEILSEFFELLPNEFEAKELAPLAKILDKHPRTLERMLERLVKLKWVWRVKRGKYKKQDMTGLTEESDSNY